MSFKPQDHIEGPSSCMMLRYKSAITGRNCYKNKHVRRLFRKLQAPTVAAYTCEDKHKLTALHTLSTKKMETNITS